MSEDRAGVCSNCGTKEGPFRLYNDVDYCEECFDELFAYCHNCEQSFKVADTIEHEGGVFCDDCYDEIFTTCDICGETIRQDSAESFDDKTLCDSCFDRYVDRCSCCDEYARVEDMRDTRDGLVCVSCFENYYYYVDCCEEYVHSDNTCHGQDITICTSCESRYYTWCEHSVDYIHNNNIAGHCRECRDYCDSICSYRLAPASGDFYIHGYHFKPLPIFHGPAKEQYGMELETDCYSNKTGAANALGALSECEQNFHIEYDGSLRNGFEIVFQPRDLESWKTYDLDSITKAVRDNGGKSFNTTTCGIHIHRSRHGISDITLTKLITVIIKMRDQIIKVAQRHNERYASYDYYSQQVNGNTKLVYKTLKDRYNGFSQERYVALNLRNHSTIEFRIFKGTLKASTIRAYLEFCDAIINWVKLESLKRIIDYSSADLWDLFRKFVKSNYKNLDTYCISKGV